MTQHLDEEERVVSAKLAERFNTVTSHVCSCNSPVPFPEVLGKTRLLLPLYFPGLLLNCQFCSCGSPSPTPIPSPSPSPSPGSSPSPSLSPSPSPSPSPSVSPGSGPGPIVPSPKVLGGGARQGPPARQKATAKRVPRPRVPRLCLASSAYAFLKCDVDS